MNKSTCVPACFGLFADITKLGDPQDRFGSEVYTGLAEEYEDYKRGWKKDVVYPQKIIGKYILRFSSFYESIILEEFQKISKLHWVKIYFSTPTFDCITKDLKANFMTKISTVGKNLEMIV